MRGRLEGGAQAHEVNRRLVAGRDERLELDLGLRDHYGRLLAYVCNAQCRSGEA